MDGDPKVMKELRKRWMWWGKTGWWMWWEEVVDFKKSGGLMSRWIWEKRWIVELMSLKYGLSVPYDYYLSVNNVIFVTVNVPRISPCFVDMWLLQLC